MSILSKNTKIGGYKPLLNDAALQSLISSMGLGETTDEGVLAAAITKIATTKATDSTLGAIKLSTGNTTNNAVSDGEAVAYKVINQTTINLNNYTTEGNYTILTPSAGNCSNFPTNYAGLSSSYGWHLTVWREYTTNWVMQLITREQQGDIFVRYNNSGSWSSWCKLINSNNQASSVTKVNNKEVLTAYGSSIRTVQGNFNNCTSLGYGLCNSTNAPNSSCSEWGFLNLPSSKNGSNNSSSILQLAWLCGNHSTYATFYYRHYNGSGTGWSAWNTVGHNHT